MPMLREMSELDEVCCACESGKLSRFVEEWDGDEGFAVDIVSFRRCGLCGHELVDRDEIDKRFGYERDVPEGHRYDNVLGVVN